MPEYADLLIELSRQAENQYWVRLSFSQPDGQAQIAPQSGPAAFDFDALRMSAQKPDVYGRLLTGAIFPSETLRSFYEKCMASAAQVGQELRPRILIDRSALELNNLRWDAQLDALDIPATVKLIHETKSEIVINLGTAFVNMSVLEACLETGAAYMDTAIHEDPDKVCEDPPWYANYEWKRKDRCKEKGMTAILGVGFDPGVVNAYCALAVKRYFDKIDTIDILDVNAGSHGKYFATNFDPEINFREFIKVWTWIDRQWKEYPTHSVKRVYDFPVVGTLPDLPERPRRAALAVEEHRRQQHPLLDGLRRPLHQRLHGAAHARLPLAPAGHADDRPGGGAAQGRQGAAARSEDAGAGLHGQDLHRQLRQGQEGRQRARGLHLPGLRPQQCYEEVESQGISYTAGVPPVAAAMLVAPGSGIRRRW